DRTDQNGFILQAQIFEGLGDQLVGYAVTASGAIVRLVLEVGLALVLFVEHLGPRMRDLVSVGAHLDALQTALLSHNRLSSFFSKSRLTSARRSFRPALRPTARCLPRVRRTPRACGHRRRGGRLPPSGRCLARRQVPARCRTLPPPVRATGMATM